VENLLDLSRLQAGNVEPRREWCSVDEIVRVALSSVSQPVGGFDVRLEEGLPSLTVDAAQLERAFANVLENAARFAGQGPVSVDADRHGDWVVLRVSDHGPGIRPEERDRIFEPFYRSMAQTTSGSGLGLAIARGFVEANGGMLHAESGPGGGSPFVFQLPVPGAVPVASRPGA
jgi:two-component system sensor histidine kinase KdpD